jgi:hypothetical protein
VDGFISFIVEDSPKVIQPIKFDGTDPNGANIVSNGIEQCAFNPRDGKFWLNIPNTGPATANPRQRRRQDSRGNPRFTSSRYSTSRRHRLIRSVVAERRAWQSAPITKLALLAAVPMLWSSTIALVTR